MDFVSYFFLTKETKKRREERRNVELTPYFIFVPFLYTFFSAFLSFSILSSYSSSPSFFPRLIFLLGTSSSLHHFSHDVFLDRFLSIPRTRNRYIFPTNTFVIVVKWWTSALASTMPVPSGLFIPVFKVWKMTWFIYDHLSMVLMISERMNERLITLSLFSKRSFSL